MAISRIKAKQDAIRNNSHNIVAIKNKFSGKVVEGKDLTPYLIQYALNSPGEFSFRYGQKGKAAKPAEGRSYDVGATAPAGEVNAPDTDPNDGFQDAETDLTEDQMLAMDLNQLKAYALSLDLDFSDDTPQVDLIDMILVHQTTLKG
jgi:hypothetical protein